MIVINFFVALFFSFIGSIPPATINLLAVQLGFEDKFKIAVRLAIGASIIEYFYAWIAVKFEAVIVSMPVIANNFLLITGIVMLTLGIITLRVANKPSTRSKAFNDSGFRRGVILGILNPLAIPYWIGWTASLESQHWIDLSTIPLLHSYLLGVLLGGLLLLISVAYLSKKLISRFQHSVLLRKIPGIAMLVLGVGSLVQYIFQTYIA